MEVKLRRLDIEWYDPRMYPGTLETVEITPWIEEFLQLGETFLDVDAYTPERIASILAHNLHYLTFPDFKIQKPSKDTAEIMARILVTFYNRNGWACVCREYLEFFVLAIQRCSLPSGPISPIPPKIVVIPYKGGGKK